MTEPRTRLTLAELLAGLAPVAGHSDTPVRSLALDCRQIDTDDVFVALAGQTAHGLDYLEQALERGAVAVLHDGKGQPPESCSVPVIAIDHLSEHLPELARRLWGDPAATMELIAVTGTNGKSSVAWLLAQALDGAMIGTLGIGRPGQHQPGSHTTPDLLSLYRALARLRDAGIKQVVIEASSHALDQQRLAGLAFSSVIFTTLGHDHLDYHPDRKAYGAAKARLFSDYPSQRQIINVDDDFGAELAAGLSGSPGLTTISVDGIESADLSVKLESATRAGLRCTLNWTDRSLAAQSPLLGRINLYNLAIVAAELAARGCPDAEITNILAALMPVPGRMEPMTGPGDCLVVIDYAHTPDALENALNSLRALEPEQLWCVFGCGGDRDRAKRPLMGRIAESLADRVVLTNDNPRHEEPLAIVREIQSGMRHPHRVQVQPDRGEAIRRALVQAGRDDLVLIAGKGHETEQVIGDTRHPFSDIAAVQRALEEAA